jgi:hypothetical protein
MRYEIQFLDSPMGDLKNKNWTSIASFCKVFSCRENDESKIMSSLVSFCTQFPEAISRHNTRIFDNYIYDWAVMATVPDQFEAYIDPICIIWNHHLPSSHPLLEFRQIKSR